MIQTPLNYSIFYYGYVVDDTNFMLDFDEGAGELTAEIDIGSYSLTQFLVAVENAMNSEGLNTYDLTVDRDTRLITISSADPFDLLVTTGSHIGQSIWSLLGFVTDQTGSNTYTATVAAGDFYEPQFRLQDYVGSESFQKAADGVVNKSASGEIEVVRFGVEKFVQFNIKYATNRNVGNSPIHKSNPTGVEDLIRFCQYMVTKGPFEVMYDINDRDTFQTLILDSTPFDNKGIGYELKELYDKGLLGFFETGKYKFRLIGDE